MNMVFINEQGNKRFSWQWTVPNLVLAFTAPRRTVQSIKIIKEKSCIRAMPDYVSTFRIKQEQEKNGLPMCLRITVMFRSVENKDSLG